MPAISIAGDLEFEVQDDYDDGNEEEATLKLYNFLEQMNILAKKMVMTDHQTESSIFYWAFKIKPYI